jgi:ubiquinone/menaquinone biosynthesis C-methylase UbiE
MEQTKIDNYRSARGAAAYHSDYQRKLHRKLSDRLERRIFAQFFGDTGRMQRLLDLPCGAGRLHDLFAAHADQVIEADFSPSMLGLNRELHGASARAYVCCSGLEIPFADRSVDAVVSVRLSHHLVRREDRVRHLRELFRVADRAVLVTWFSAWSVKNVLRRLRAPFDRKSPKHTLASAEVVAIADACGFRKLRCTPLSRLASGHVFGSFVRRRKGP